MGNVTLDLFDPRVATASELRKLLEDSKVTSFQLVLDYLKEIEVNNGYLHAVITTAPRESLLEQAKKLDQERRQGTVRSTMHGIPILVKVWVHCYNPLHLPKTLRRLTFAQDNIATSPSLGMETTAGSLALIGSRPRKSADLIEKVLPPCHPSCCAFS